MKNPSNSSRNKYKGQIKENSPNKLNDLTAKEWLINTKSVWTSFDYHLSKKDSEDIRYLRNLILFFTKKNDTILNPNGNADVASIGQEENRIILSETEDAVDFIVLNASQTFASLRNYLDYLMCKDLISNFTHFFRILKTKKYFCVITRDFYFPHNSELMLYHCDLINLIRTTGFRLKGLIIWVPRRPKERSPHMITDSNQSLLNDYILIFRKERDHETSIESNESPFILNYDENFSVCNDTLYHISYMKSISPPRDKHKAQHPATFPEPDIKKLIKFYTKIKENPKVLDPFSGVGSTLIACLELNIPGFGIELTNKWIELTKQRFFERGHSIIINGKKFFPSQKVGDIMQKNLVEKPPPPQILEQGDALETLASFPDTYFDFIITSPPYWGILTKKIDHKTKKERVQKGLKIKYTIEGQDATFSQDLANIASYDAFLNALRLIYKRCFIKLKNHSYIAAIVSDFRHGPNFYLYHHDTAQLLKQSGFKLIGLIILHQDNKNLYPYGYPNVFVSNIHHQYIVIAKKE